MDKIIKYRKVIQNVLRPYESAQYAGSPDVKNQLIFDTEHDHYLVVTIGWEDEKPVRDCIFHIDIINGQVWIQEDNTDSDIAEMFQEAGIPKKDIVLGYHSPMMRQYISNAAA